MIRYVGDNFCLGSIPKEFTEDEQSEISLNGIVYDFSVDNSLIKKEDKFIIHKCFMVKSNIK